MLKREPSEVKEVKLPEELRIVDDDTWNAVQAKIAERSRVPLPRRKLPKHPLSGLLFCGVCGSSYTVSDPKRCACSGRSERGICTNRRRVDRRELEQFVLLLMRDTLLDAALVESYVKTYRAEHRRLLGQIESENASLRKKVEKAGRQLQRLISELGRDDTDESTRAALRMAIRGRTEELEVLQKEAEGSKIRHVPVYDCTKITARLQDQLEKLPESLSADTPDSARAREVMRGLIDRIVIYPVGEDDGRGCGPVKVELKGRISSLVNLGEDSPNRVVQSGLGTESRLNHVTWSASRIMENSNKVLKTSAPTNTDLIVEFLRRAKAPVAPTELVAHIVESCGLDCSKHTLHMVKVRVTRALDYLRTMNIAVVAMVPGMRKFRWALAEREREFWPQGIPARAGNYADTDKVLDVLGKAQRLLSVAEIARQVAIASGEQPRKKRLNYLGCRVRGCLHFLRTQGSVLQVTYAGTQKQGWVLASRKEEMLLSGAVQPDGKVTNGATVLSILGSSKGPMTAVQIAEALLTISGDPPTEINTRRAVYRVRDHLRDFKALGLVRDVKTKGSLSLWVLAERDAQARSDQAA